MGTIVILCFAVGVVVTRFRIGVVAFAIRNERSNVIGIGTGVVLVKLKSTTVSVLTRRGSTRMATSV